jgi:hypothetical protein
MSGTARKMTLMLCLTLNRDVDDVLLSTSTLGATGAVEYLQLAPLKGDGITTRADCYAVETICLMTFVCDPYASDERHQDRHMEPR